MATPTTPEGKELMLRELRAVLERGDLMITNDPLRETAAYKAMSRPGGPVPARVQLSSDSFTFKPDPSIPPSVVEMRYGDRTVMTIQNVAADPIYIPSRTHSEDQPGYILDAHKVEYLKRVWVNPKAIWGPISEPSAGLSEPMKQTEEIFVRNASMEEIEAAVVESDRASLSGVEVTHPLKTLVDGVVTPATRSDILAVTRDIARGG